MAGRKREGEGERERESKRDRETRRAGKETKRTARRIHKTSACIKFLIGDPTRRHTSLSARPFGLIFCLKTIGPIVECTSVRDAAPHFLQ